MGPPPAIGERPQNGGSKKKKGVSFTSQGRESGGAAETAVAPVRFGVDPVGSSKSSSSPLTKRRRELEDRLGVYLPSLDVVPRTLFDAHFVGLKNLGATCYMNALLQTMFTTPEIRKHIIQFAFEAQQRHPRNVAYYLQLLFSKMQEKHLWNAVPTRELVDSFGMGQNAHREQHDVQELNRVLLDVLETFIVKSSSTAAAAPADAGPAAPPPIVPNIIREMYEGHFNDVLRCKSCGFTRKNQVPFLDVVLPLCSMMGEAYDAAEGIRISSLEDCLDRFVCKDEIEGVECDGCHGKHTAEKYVTFSDEKMPKMLTMQLLRLQYNIVTGQRDKINKDISLPLEIDFNRWSSSSSEPRTAENDAQTVVGHSATAFRLHGVICHRGTAYHGHYYAYIRCFEENGPQWYLFDDESVQPVSDTDVLEYLDPSTWRALHSEKPETAPAPPTNPAAEVPQPEVVAAASVDGGDTASGAASADIRSSNSCGAPPPVPIGNENVDTELALLFGGDAVTSAATIGPKREYSKNHVSGHVYYALYRRVDLPAFTGSECFDAPSYVIDALQPAREAVHRDLVELMNMWHKVPVSVWVGDLNRARTAEYRRTQLQQLSGRGVSVTETHLAEDDAYFMRQVWIDGDWSGTLLNLVQQTVESIGTKTEWLDTDPWLVELLCAASEGSVRLRAFDTTLQVFGETYDNLALLLSDVAPPNRNSAFHIGVEIVRATSAIPTEEELEPSPIPAPSATSLQSSDKLMNKNKWDNAFTVYVQSPTDASDFPVTLREVICCKRGTTVEGLKSQLAITLGIAEDSQVLTVVTNGEALVRRSGILTGDIILVERKEPGRPVGNHTDGTSLVSAEALCDEFTGVAVADSDDVIYPSRGALYMKRQFAMTVKYFYADSSVTDAFILKVLSGASSRVAVDDICSRGGDEDENGFKTLIVDRRSSLSFVKQRLLVAFGLRNPSGLQDERVCFDPAAEEHQLWSGKSGVASEPRNMETTLFAVALGAPEIRVALVHRKIVREHERSVELFVLEHPLQYHLSYEELFTFIARISVPRDATTSDLIRSLLSVNHQASMWFNNSSDVDHYRFRLLNVDSLRFPLGYPLFDKVLETNKVVSARAENETLRISIEKIPTYPLLESSMPAAEISNLTCFLHVHRWNSAAECPFDALGCEVEIPFSTRLTAAALQETLSEMFDIPVDKLEAGPLSVSQALVTSAGAESLLCSHDSVYTQIAWGSFSDTTLASIPLGTAPFSFVKDHVILIRSRDDDWVWVSQEALSAGHKRLWRPFKQNVKSPKAPVKKNAVDAAVPETSSGAKDTLPQVKKRARNETGISIQAVWEWNGDDETAAEGKEGVEEASNKPPTTTSPTSITALGGNDELIYEEHPQKPSAAGEPTLADFSEIVAFDPTSERAHACPDCKICLTAFESQDSVCILPCDHHFHTECLTPWLAQSNVCPSCAAV